MASTTTKWILELIDKITSPMDDIISSTEKGRESADKMGESFKSFSAIDLHAISQSIDNILGMLDRASAPGIAFDSAKKEMQSITMLADKEIAKIGGNAREAAKQYGLAASGMMDSYTGLIARFGPEIAESDQALAKMGSNIATLSKLMKNDTAGAMDAATTAMLQYGVSLEDPIAAAEEMTRMINIMAAAGNEGASEVDMTAEALKNAGVQAKNANVTFAETNATLQALAQGGLYGAQAGMKLRNILSKMAGEDIIPAEAAEKLRMLGVNYDIVSDKTIPFTERLRELKKAQGDATIMAQIFGIQNEAAAQIILNNLLTIDELTEKITGTNAAFDSAAVVMSSYEERMARMKSRFSDIGISIFNVTKRILPFVTGIGAAVGALANLANARKGVVLLITTLKSIPVVGGIVTGAFNLMSMAARGLGSAIMSIPIAGWIAAAIAVLAAFGAYFWKTSAEFRSVLTGMWEAVKVVFTGIGGFIGEVAQGIWHLLKGVFNPVNWFDDNYKFADGLDKITGAARKYGEDIGKAFTEGREKGMEGFYAANPDKRPSSSGPLTTGSKSTNLNRDISPVITPVLSQSSGGSGGGLSGSGGVSGVKNISQKIEIKNYFSVDGNTNVEVIAERVVRAINDRLRDSMVIAG